MDVWPSVERQSRSIINSSSDSDSEAPHNPPRNEHAGGYPLYEGGPTAANLREHEGRRLMVTRDPTLVFPQTRPEPPPVNVRVKQKTEEAANFIRLHYPDVEFASEVIKEQLTEDATSVENRHQFDSCSGNLLSHLPFGVGSRKRTAYMCFPMGETGCDLNISNLTWTPGKGVTFVPSANSSWSFTTPIQQLASVPHSAGEAGSLLSVRTLSATTFFHGNDVRGALRLKELGSLSRSNLEGAQIIDALPRFLSEPSALLASNNGDVYHCTFTEGLGLSNRVHSTGEQRSDKFWRLAETGNSDTCLLLSASNLNLLDLRAPGGSSSVLVPSQSRDLFTSVEGDIEDQLLRLCSTNQVLWFDARFSSRPVIAVQHRRQFDRTLRTRTISFTGNLATILYGSSNGLLTIYDISRPQTGPIQLHVPPYCVTTSPQSSAGQAFLPHEASAEGVSFFHLSPFGGLHKVDLGFSADGDPAGMDHPTGNGYKWSSDVKTLADESKTLGFDFGPMGARRCEEQNFRELYRELFCERAVSDDPDAVYDLLDSMPATWQSLEPPVEHPLTTYEIARLSESGSLQDSRSGTMTSTLLNSVRGYRALVQGRIPREKLRKRAPLHLNIAPTLRHLVPNMHHDARQIVKNVEAFDLISEGNRPASSVRTETESREQLAVDLVLSADIFSQRPVQKPPVVNVMEDPLEVMSRATEAMSLSDAEPPVVHFGFLQPVGTDCGDDGTITETRPGGDERGDGDDLESSANARGIRLLLSEWTLGTNPQEYVFEDPYGVCDTPSQKPLFLAAGYRTAIVGSTTQSIPSQRPPAVIPSIRPILPSTLQPPRNRPSSQPQMLPPISGSQPVRMDWEATGQSQEKLASTQVVPGPHGGRFPPVKKPAKKRVGGF